MQYRRICKQDEPVNSQKDFGIITPTLGRTQYFFGDVVLTCQRHQNYIAVPSTLGWNFPWTLPTAINKQYAKRTLKATWQSVLFVRQMEHELCFFNSPIEITKTQLLDQIDLWKSGTLKTARFNPYCHFKCVKVEHDQNQYLKFLTLLKTFQLYQVTNAR